MLILPKYLREPVKNPVWEIRTPNEAYRDDLSYSELVDFFLRKNGLPGNPTFFQIRVTKPSIVAGEGWWYEEAVFVDKIFWVVQKPLRFFPEGEPPWQGWVLEPLEHLRVHKAVSDDKGNSPYPPDQLFIIPCDAAHLAWEETSNGYSDHIEWRPDTLPTQQEVDRNGHIQTIADNLLKEGIDITGREEFQGSQDPRFWEINRKP